MNEFALTRTTKLFIVIMSCLVALLVWNSLLTPLLNSILASIGAGSLAVLWISRFGPASALVLTERMRNVNSWAIYCSIESHTIKLTSENALTAEERTSTTLYQCPLISCAPSLITYHKWGHLTLIEREIYVPVTVMKDGQKAKVLMPYGEMAQAMGKLPEAYQ